MLLSQTIRKRGIQLLPGHDEIFSLLFADDIALVSSTPSGLQNQINSLEKASKSLGLTVNLDKTKVRFSRKVVTLQQEKNRSCMGKKSK